MEESYLAETATLQIIDSKRIAKPFGSTRYSAFYTTTFISFMFFAKHENNDSI